MEGVNRESQFDCSWCHLCLFVFICGFIFVLLGVLGVLGGSIILIGSLGVLAIQLFFLVLLASWRFILNHPEVLA